MSGGGGAGGYRGEARVREGVRGEQWRLGQAKHTDLAVSPAAAAAAQ